MVMILLNPFSFEIENLIRALIFLFFLQFACGDSAF